MSHPYAIEPLYDPHTRPVPYPLNSQVRKNQPEDPESVSQHGYDHVSKYLLPPHSYQNSLLRSSAGGHQSVPVPSHLGYSPQSHEHIEVPRFVSQDYLQGDPDASRIRGAYTYPYSSGLSNQSSVTGHLHSQPAVPPLMPPPNFSNGLALLHTPHPLAFGDSNSSITSTDNSVDLHRDPSTSETSSSESRNGLAFDGMMSSNGQFNNGLNNLQNLSMGNGVEDQQNGLIERYSGDRQKNTKDKKDLMSMIPSITNSRVSKQKEPQGRDADLISTQCSRCKKDFLQDILLTDKKDGSDGAGTESEPRIYKLCHHCRELQRQRSRRWQKKTKDKLGACRRCGVVIPPGEQKYVLCPQCRLSLRVRKANRAAQGKCVHCLGPIQNTNNEEDGERRSSITGLYKVCQRCRENDKIRRTNLERMGNCNRCAKTLLPSEQGRHKVCSSCRQKKKRLSSTGDWVLSQPSNGVAAPPLAPAMPQVGHGPGKGMLQDVGAPNYVMPPMNFAIPAEQPAMMMGLANQMGQLGQDYPGAYGAYSQPYIQQLPQPVMQHPAQEQVYPTNPHGFQGLSG